ncbi:sensor domain-containing diguanylate cyclase [Azotosporobacter soli]|uniref:sensor domain-containing diguanylate cyclase n=1 Tax=Azotosporobacter soli TaxID=3055040 RepID=UPI0031FE7911
MLGIGGCDTEKIWRLAERLINCTDALEIRRIILEEGCRLFPGSRGVLFGVQAQTAKLQVLLATEPELCGLEKVLKEKKEILLWLKSPQHPLLLEAGKNWSGSLERAEISLDAILALPLKRDGELEGVLCIINLDHANSLYAMRLAALQRMASLAMAAKTRAEQAEKLKKELTAGRKKEAELRRWSYQDALTGLKNRRYLEERIKKWEHELEKRHLALIICDCDGLKEVNDSYGHIVGDQYLTNTAELLRQCCPETGAWIRLGGDEFVLFWPDGSVDEVKKLCRKIKNLSVRLPGVKGVQGSLSVGWAVARGAEKTLWQIIKEADGTMYKAKRRSKQERLERTLEML